MSVKHSARRYDIIDAAKMANENAVVEVTSGPDLIIFKWTWGDKIHQVSINPDEDDEFILLTLFRSAIKMSKM